MLCPYLFHLRPSAAYPRSSAYWPFAPSYTCIAAITRSGVAGIWNSRAPQAP